MEEATDHREAIRQFLERTYPASMPGGGWQAAEFQKYRIKVERLETEEAVRPIEVRFNIKHILVLTFVIAALLVMVLEDDFTWLYVFLFALPFLWFWLRPNKTILSSEFRRSIRHGFKELFETLARLK